MPTIKFKDLIEGELQNKVRKVKDLVDYVGKIAPSHPNYSIFLGAGASVASGIKTGGNLVNEWRRETYEKDGLDYYDDLDKYSLVEREEFAKERAIDYLIKKHGVWYNPQNEYSSLFERKFDLPVQRRRFVEDLVDNHLPSIGYLFLITLINNNYFNTIFTTNFDDLINEAFYQFSNTRPILCAHDSAVSSISVVAKRPKIIKLHGDYLFDDIKNTIKETESLEQNIKQKFIEFTKDNGLIVVGYSGQDRSILDVLNYLLQQEDYLKNGLYWCFRAEDEISHEVRKILWKDKVYCVQIDGFDELFTEFCSVANVKPNLIDNLSENKRESCIKKFVKDYNEASIKNPWISDFIEEISTAKNNQDISDLIRQLNENNTQNLSSDQLRTLLSIEALIKKNDSNGALSLVNEKIKDETDEELVENYHKLKVRIYKIQNNKDKAFKMIDELIENDEFNMKYYLWKLMFLTDIKDKVSYLCEVNQKVDYSPGIKNAIIQMFLKYHKDHDGDLTINFDDCENLINESLKLDPSSDNDAYNLKFDFLKIKKNKILKLERVVKTRTEKLERNESDLTKLIDCISNINKFNPEFIKIKRDYVLYKKDLMLVKNFISEVDDIKKRLSKEKSKEVVGLIAHMFNDICVYTKDEIKDVNNWRVLSELEVDDYFSSYSNSDIKSKNLIFMLELAKYIVSKKNDMNLLNEVLDKTLSISESFAYINRICDRFTWAKDKDISRKLESFVMKNKSRLSDSDFLYSMYSIERSKSNYIEALKYLKKYNNLIDLESEDYVSLIYLHLLSGNYEDVLEFISKNKLKIEKFSNGDKGIVLINEFTAKKLKNNKLDISDRQELEKIIAKHSENKRILICANSLLEKNSEALHHIKELIFASFTFFHEVKEWPAINENLKDEATRYFNSLINSNSKIQIA
ncbi:SIR2 family protein [Acinetobacter sp. ANC 4169]|uniref:SIR2 family protein n=1 Tax=Acinetobacter sp. ANC 4169 TaxID=1977879 RepID=UPI00148A5F06|nr:SIR2 family protein [Acinetobacter sp. ANC 4169]